MKYQDSFTQENSRLGSELSPRDQQTVLNQFVHRMTVENKRRFPDYARNQIASGYRMPEKTDAQWLAETRFATNRFGVLKLNVSNCEQTHESTMRDLAIVKAQDETKSLPLKSNALKTLPFNCAAQIASDIRGDCLPDRLPAHIERRLEATIDAVLAVERAKVETLIDTLQSIHDDADHALGTDSEPQERLSVARQDLQTIRESAQSALFALQA